MKIKPRGDGRAPGAPNGSQRRVALRCAERDTRGRRARRAGLAAIGPGLYWAALRAKTKRPSLSLHKRAVPGRERKGSLGDFSRVAFDAIAFGHSRLGLPAFVGRLGRRELPGRFLPAGVGRV